MTAYMSNLSFNVIGGICKFLSEQTISQLRQVKVCKSINKHIFSLVKILKTDIESVCLQWGDFESSCFKWKPQLSYRIIIMIKGRKDYFMWKLCFIHVVNEYMTLLDHVGQNTIVLYFTPEKMKPALQCLKTFFLQARLCELYVFCHIKPEILLIFLDLVAEKSFENVYVMDNRKCNMDLSIWTEWIRKIRSQYLEFPSTMTSLNKDSVEFIHSAASAAKTLSLRIPKSMSMPMILSIVHDILSRQCEGQQLIFRNSLSQEETECMVQLLHHCDKKVEFADGRDKTRLQMECQIGMYNVSVDNFGFLKIKHV